VRENTSRRVISAAGKTVPADFAGRIKPHLGVHLSKMQRSYYYGRDKKYFKSFICNLIYHNRLKLGDSREMGSG
jgi:hypothetical protein